MNHCLLVLIVDIRDTINYKEVMRGNRLGPNGAIVTSLNLFSTKFDMVTEAPKIFQTIFMCDMLIDLFVGSGSPENPWEAVQVYFNRHTRPDRSVHVECLWKYYYGTVGL